MKKVPLGALAWYWRPASTYFAQSPAQSALTAAGSVGRPAAWNRSWR
ncbi:hypothetical protein ACFQ0T_37850 [Kitasatospora gansuensis]